MATLSLVGNRICVELGDDHDGDVLMSSEVARHAARSLSRLAIAAIYMPESCERDGPEIAVYCSMRSGRPLVRWVFARKVKMAYLPAPMAIELSCQTKLAAIDAESKCKWLELREPEELVS